MRSLLRAYSLAVTERAMAGVGCLHRITRSWVVHAPFEETQVLGCAVHIANPDLYTNKGKLTES